MIDQNTPRSQTLDGIASPDVPDAVPTPPNVPPSTSPTQTPSPRPRFTGFLRIVLIAFAVAYILPGLVAMTLFPRPDTTLENFRLLATTVYPLGGLVWLLLGIFAALRVSAIKDRPRLRFFAFLRLAAFVVPLLLVSAFTPLLINRPPTLGLEILKPESSALIAPVSVTFGLPTALQYFTANRLTPLKYQWDFNGDGKFDQESFEPEAVYLYDRSVISTVSCLVTMTTGQTTRLSVRIVVPQASFGMLPLQPIIEQPVTFSLTNLIPKGTGAPTLTKAAWDFDGDGTADLETDKPSATTTYHKLGSVKVSVAVSLSNQTQQTFQRSFEVVEPPKQPFPISLETEPATLLGPPPFGVLFTLKTKEPIASASWDFGNQKTAEGLRVAQVFTAVGSYSVSVVARSQSGATAKLSTLVRVTNPLSIPDLSFDGTSPVRGFEIQGQVPLTVDITPVTSLPLISFSWDATDAPEATISDKNFRAVYRDTGTYFVDLIGTDPDQNVFRKRIKITAQQPQSFVNFSMTPDTPIAPASVTFDGSDTFVPDDEITGFEWSFGDRSGDATKFSGARIDHVFEAAGSYVITLKVKTTAGKEYTTQRTLVVRAPIVDACFLPSRRSGKAPLGVRFETDCSTGTFTRWLWDFGDDSQSDQQTPTHVFLTPGDYTVTLTATAADGSKNTKSTTISVSE